MTNQQGLRQQSVRDVTGTELTYNGDWMALFAQSGITISQFDGALLAWLNDKLEPETPYQNLPRAMQAFAEDQGFYNWSSMGTFDAS